MEFVSQEEGGQFTTGYVPADPDNPGQPHPNSGVTIGTGVDLYGRTQQSLAQLGLDQPLIDALLPYTTQQGGAAREVAANLTITPEQANALDNAIKAQFYAEIEGHYNSASTFADFRQLPPNAQTVIFSVVYQYGMPAVLTHDFWTQVTTGDWQAAYNNLMNYQDSFGPRRQREAARLLEDMNAYTMPSPQNPC